METRGVGSDSVVTFYNIFPTFQRMAVEFCMIEELFALSYGIMHDGL